MMMKRMKLLGSLLPKMRLPDVVLVLWMRMTMTMKVVDVVVVVVVVVVPHVAYF